MAHPDCTAVVGEGEPPPNPLFTPPCHCPDCAPTQTFEQRQRDDGWLRVRGHQQRYRVEPVILGELGTKALG
ncbi:MAG: hypothetical protein AAGA65_24430 [Actinomycetota bacterium]